MRQFGVLIDQVRFHEYITGRPELDPFYLFNRVTQVSSELPVQA